MQLVVGHAERPEYVSLHSWPWSSNTLFNWTTTIDAANSTDLFIGICMKDRYDHLLVKFRFCGGVFVCVLLFWRIF